MADRSRRVNGENDVTLKTLLTIAASALIVCGSFVQDVAADEPGGIRHIKRNPHVKLRPSCRPHERCLVPRRIACPDGWSCYSLYGAYGPYGGSAYWSRFTYHGWGHRW